MRVTVITGAPGVGKTETARRLATLYPGRTALLDTDHLATFLPWNIDDVFLSAVVDNLTYCLQTFRRVGLKQAVVSGVIVPDGIYSRIASLLSDSDFIWTFYALVADEDAVLRRINSDTKPSSPEFRLKWFHLNNTVQSIPDCTVLDTSAFSLPEVVMELAVREGLADATSHDLSDRSVVVKTKHAAAVAQRALEMYGTPTNIAAQVVTALLDAELAGHPSHGLIRLPEYVEGISSGLVLPDALPTATSAGQRSRLVDGCRGFGVLAADRVAQELCDQLENDSLVAVGLTNSNHIGRLMRIAEKVCQKGHLVIGFCNYLGAGQKVPPWGGAQGRSCTNPLLIGIPSSTEPFILDMTTSAVSEGAVRLAAIRGDEVPNGWLIDSDGNPVYDPRRLYEDPPSAFLAPLGGSQGYKGAALSLMAEVLAGVITGAGYTRPNPGPGGNGGLFIGLRSSLLGRDSADFQEDIQRLITYYLECPTSSEENKVRMPGHASLRRHAEGQARGTVTIPRPLWTAIEELSQHAEKKHDIASIQ